MRLHCSSPIASPDSQALPPTAEIPPLVSRGRDLGAHVVLAVFAWFYGVSCRGLAAGLQAALRHSDLSSAEREMWCRAVVGCPCNRFRAPLRGEPAHPRPLWRPETRIGWAFVSCAGTSLCGSVCPRARAGQVDPRFLEMPARRSGGAVPNVNYIPASTATTLRHRVGGAVSDGVWARCLGAVSDPRTTHWARCLTPALRTSHAPGAGARCLTPALRTYGRGV
jgi:hypothetical protein